MLEIARMIPGRAHKWQDFRESDHDTSPFFIGASKASSDGNRTWRSLRGGVMWPRRLRADTPCGRPCNGETPIRASRDVHEAIEPTRIRIEPSSSAMNGRCSFWWSMTVPVSSGRRSFTPTTRSSTAKREPVTSQELAIIRRFAVSRWKRRGRELDEGGGCLVVTRPISSNG